MANKNMERIGAWAYVIGLGGAILLGLLSGLNVFTGNGWLATVLIFAGLTIGFLNITRKEAVPFMVAVLVLGVGSLTAIPFVGNILDAVLKAIASVSIPAGLVVAVRTIIKGAR